MKFHPSLFCLAISVSLVLGVGQTTAEASTESVQADFYVAPYGNDAYAGTKQKPFRSLQRARDAVRLLKNTKPEKDILVLLRGGYYRLADTIIFGLEDSALEGQKITYAAYSGEHPVIGSGVPITGWKKVSDDLPGLPEAARGEVWCAPIPEGIAYFTSLFNGQRTLPRSRSAGFRPTAISKSQTQTNFPKGLIPVDAAERGIDLRIVPNSPWVVNLLPITKVDPVKATAETSVPGTYPLNKPRFGYFPHGTAWLENAVEFIDGPGKWALDKKKRLIYLWHEGHELPSGIVVPKLTELVRVEGKIDYTGPDDTSVRGLIFRGLTFTHADYWRWSPEKTGWGLQHDWEMFDRPTAMLRFRGAEDCAVEQCEFTNAGSTAIRCDLYARRIRIARNHIHHVGGVGVLLAGYGPGTKDVNVHNAVIDNHIHHIGRILWHAPGIFVWQSGSNRIAHNHVHDVAYTGIVVSGRIGWNRKRAGECSNTLRWEEIDRATADASRNPKWGRGVSLVSWRQREPFLHGRRNVIEYNNIHHCMCILGDGNGKTASSNTALPPIRSS
ncbi:MAG: right-handed parallel beta-helix repeat-containing protein [Pirellulales bacterium]|nr:right-handed parallel beta-helix repeat-containing protein [Pirellulales bacterium]